MEAEVYDGIVHVVMTVEDAKELSEEDRPTFVRLVWAIDAAFSDETKEAA